MARRYRLVDEVGRGAMGIVWRGRDELLDRDVAIKQIVLAPMASATEAQSSYQRTLREARSAARLSHPGVVTVFDVVEEDGSPWIVMELVRARPLDQVIAEDGPLPPARAAQLGLGLLDALTTAHQAGVLHRDVKPSNVLISPNGKAVLTDFGIAQIQGDPGLTQAGMVVGTPGFSPPERIRGTAATTASDLWSLGATLYAAVEGRGPFDRAGGSAAIVASIATEPAPRAPSAGPLAPVIEALLRADPAQRPDSATTARMLTQAWKSARTAARGNLLGDALLGDAPLGEALPGDAPPAAAQARANASLEATTATQVVSVPPDLGSLGRPLEADLVAAGAQGPEALDSASSDTASPSVATGVVPDLMATPNFAELKMPAAPLATEPTAAADAASVGALATDPQRPAPPGRGRTTTRKSRGGRNDRLRVLFVAVPVLVLGVAAAVVYLGPRGLSDPLAGGGAGQDHLAHHAVHKGGRTGTSHAGGHGKAHHTSGKPGTHPKPVTSHRPGKHKPGGKPSASPRPGPSGRPSASSKPTTSPKPSASGKPSPTPTPTPTPTPSSPAATGGTPPPAGYAWYQVTAASVGTIAGFKLAAPEGWVMTPAVNTIIKAPSGPGKLDVNLATWPVAGAAKEARRLQASAIATGRYPNYHHISIAAGKFHGWPAARWRFWWRSASAQHRMVVSAVLFTVQTWEGPQQYMLSIQAPAPKTSWANGIFTVASQTFRKLPHP